MRVSDEIMVAMCNRFVPVEKLLDWLEVMILPAVQTLESDRAELAESVERLKKDAELGRLVRRLQELAEADSCRSAYLTVRLELGDQPWFVWTGSGGDLPIRNDEVGATPEEALKKALNET